MARSSAPVVALRAGALLAALSLLVSCASSPPPSRAKAKMSPAVSTQPTAKKSAPVDPAQVRIVRRTLEPDLTPTDPRDLAGARDKGWIFMVEKLAGTGVSRASAARAFADPRMPAFDGLLFGLNPRESHSMYRGFLSAGSMASAERCAAAHASELRSAERLHGVDASVVAAIMHVETHCGRNTGKSMILHRLARLAMANEPRNVARNLARYSGKGGAIEPELAEQVRSRARYLEGIFYPQVVATFEIARQEGIDPIAMRGSGAGAFGYVQFLPMNYFAFGTDGNGDGRISLYQPADAAASAARFLASYGWKPGINHEKKRQVIWHYNRSDAYIDTVLALASNIRSSGVLDPVRPEATEARALPVDGAGRVAAPVTRRP
jgi:membrane-bound lytic murein transglycosylase B